ncbi:asparagine--tRNA ligase, mitochondrial [Monosporozyma servazzii]
MSTLIKQLYKDVQSNILKDGTKIKSVNGYISNIHRLKNFIFIDLMDGSISTPLKIIIPSNQYNNNLFIGQSLSLHNWNCKLTPTRNHPFELVQNLNQSHLQISNDTTPFQPNEFNINLSKLRNSSLTKFKNNYMNSIIRFRSSLQLAIFTTLNNNYNFIKVDPPIITTNDTEGNNETFKLYSDNEIFPLNKSPLNLTVSTQLHLEILSQSLSNVFSLSPCFRAERSDTGRHLTEFFMLELETTQFNTLDSLTTMTQDFIISIVRQLLDNQKQLLDWNHLPLPIDTMSTQDIIQRWNRIIDSKNWHEIEYIDAIKQLNLNKSQFKTCPPTLETITTQNITTEHEKWISSTLFNNGFVFIKNYPKSLKPFYMKSNATNTTTPTTIPTVQCFDLIFPELGEIIGGSMREDNLSILKPSLPNDLNWYGELRKSGYRTSGGFGLGLERFIAYLLGLKNIKDTLPFYRSAKSKVTL